MQSTSNLIEKALAIKSGAEWGRALGVSRATLHTARMRGNLSPALAFCVAERMNEDPIYWAAIATAESEKNPKMKGMMLKTLSKIGGEFNP